MLLVTSAADAMQRSRQVHVNGRDYTLAEYVGAAPTKGIYVAGNEVNDNGLPQGFLVDLLVLQFSKLAPQAARALA